jgi:hypothetical protein
MLPALLIAANLDRDSNIGVIQGEARHCAIADLQVGDR